MPFPIIGLAWHNIVLFCFYVWVHILYGSNNDLSSYAANHHAYSFFLKFETSEDERLINNGYIYQEELKKKFPKREFKVNLFGIV